MSEKPDLRYNKSNGHACYPFFKVEPSCSRLPAVCLQGNTDEGEGAQSEGLQGGQQGGKPSTLLMIILPLGTISWS